MQVRVYYEDTDTAGVVYHSNYLNYCERARTEFFREKGLSVRLLHEQGWIFPVVRMELNFRAPAWHDDLLEVETSVASVCRTTFTMNQTVRRAHDGKVLVEAQVTLACVGSGLKARRLPPDVLSALQGNP